MEYIYQSKDVVIPLYNFVRIFEPVRCTSNETQIEQKGNFVDLQIYSATRLKQRRLLWQISKSFQQKTVLTLSVLYRFTLVSYNQRQRILLAEEDILSGNGCILSINMGNLEVEVVLCFLKYVRRPFMYTLGVPLCSTGQYSASRIIFRKPTTYPDRINHATRAV